MSSLLWQAQLAFPNDIELNLIRSPGNAVAPRKEALKRPVSVGDGVPGTLVELRVGTQDLFGDLHRAHVHTGEGQFLNRAFWARRFSAQLFGECAEARQPLHFRVNVELRELVPYDCSTTHAALARQFFDHAYQTV